MVISKEMQQCKVKPANKIGSDRSDLAILNTNVNFCINFRIQKTHLPRGLNCSARTVELSYLIGNLQEQLKESIRADYERQRDDILSKRQEKRD